MSMVEPQSTAEWLTALRSQVIGIDTTVTVRGGVRPYVNLDNAATTPALVPVQRGVEALLPWYGSVDRGAGLKSVAMSESLEASRATVRGFVGAGDGYEVLVVRGATEGFNLLAHRLVADRDTVVVTSAMEHHANFLPWKKDGTVVVAPVDAAGRLTADALEAAIRGCPSPPRVVSVSGASNVTGVLPPVRELAEVAHRYGAWFVVDGTQLIQHRPCEIEAWGVDALVFSGHKVYAPYGAGAVVARRELLAEGEPMLRGGAMARRVTLTDVWWSDPPASDEAGSLNIVGAVAMAIALDAVHAAGIDRVAAHDRSLAAHLIEGLRRLPGVRLLGPAEGEDRMATVAVELVDHDPELVATALAYEHGVAVRAGKFCAHPLVDRLTEGTGTSAIRLSAGMYTTVQELDCALDGLAAILSGDLGAYERDAATRRLRPAGGDVLPEGAFRLAEHLPAAATHRRDPAASTRNPTT